MPLPTPRAGESQNDFVSRFMSNAQAKRDFPDEKQRVAVALSTWRREKGIKRIETDMILEYNVPIIEFESADPADFRIKGIAINETITSNGHHFISEELESSAGSLIGVPLLKDHINEVDKIVGRVTSAHFDSIDNNIKFEAKIMDTKMRQMVKDGRIKTVSVGACVEDLEEMEDGDLIPRGITFKELSLVAIPADMGATFGVALKEAYNKSHSPEMVKKMKGGIVMMADEEQAQPEESNEAKPEAQPEAEAPAEEKPAEEPAESTEEAPAEATEKFSRKMLKEEMKKILKEQEDSESEEPKAEEPKAEEPAPAEEPAKEEDSEESEEVSEGYRLVESYGSLKGGAITVVR